jgi:hypothetical protein
MKQSSNGPVVMRGLMFRPRMPFSWSAESSRRLFPIGTLQGLYKLLVRSKRDPLEDRSQRWGCSFKQRV